MKKGILYVILVILIIGIVGGVTYLVLDNKEDKNKTIDNNRDISPNKEKESITLSKSELEKYLDTVPFLNTGMLPEVEYTDAYKGQMVNINNINSGLLFKIATDNVESYQFSEGETKPVFSNITGDMASLNGDEGFDYWKVDDIKTYLKNKYNYTKDLVNEFYVSGGCVYKVNDFYMLYLGYGYDSRAKISVSNSYEIKDNDFIITEEALFINGADVYKNTEDLHNEKNVLMTLDLEENDKYSPEVDYQKYINQINVSPTKYKHTFKKNGTNYYWYSTEVIE